MTPSRWLRRLVVLLLTGAALGFVALEVVRNLDELRDFEWQVRPFLLGTSTLLLIALFLWGVKIWQILLRSFGVRVAFRPLARAWFWANVSRYIPGMVWQFVSLAHLGAGAGLTPAVAVTSLLVQMGFMLLSAAIVVVYTFPLEAAGFSSAFVQALRWVAPVGILLVHPAVIRNGLGLVRRVLRRSVVEWTGSFGASLTLLALSLLTWLAYGATFYLFVLAFHPVGVADLPSLTGMNAFAFLVGYLAFFAPGGLGYKEGALAISLALLLPRPVAFSLAIVARLWTVAAELIPAAFLIRTAPRPPELSGPTAPAASGRR